MKIEIDLSDLGFHFDPDGDASANRTLQDAVVSQAARMLLSDLGYEFRNEVLTLLKAAAQDHVAALLAEVIARPIQRTTKWGEPQGEPTTLLELVRAEFEAFANNAPSNTYRTDNRPKNLAEFLSLTVSEWMRSDLAKEVRAVKAKVTDELRTKALKAAAAALVPEKG